MTEKWICERNEDHTEVRFWIWIRKRDTQWLKLLGEQGDSVICLDGGSCRWVRFLFDFVLNESFSVKDQAIRNGGLCRNFSVEKKLFRIGVRRDVRNRTVLSSHKSLYNRNKGKGHVGLSGQWKELKIDKNWSGSGQNSNSVVGTVIGWLKFCRLGGCSWIRIRSLV